MDDFLIDFLNIHTLRGLSMLIDCLDIGNDSRNITFTWEPSVLLLEVPDTTEG